MKVYEHPKCSTCKKAKAFLEQHGISAVFEDIREHTPTRDELLKAYQYAGSLRKLFNTSGMEYRKRGLKDLLPTMTPDEAFELLESDGMLIKRPFAVANDAIAVGFKESEWEVFQ